MINIKNWHFTNDKENVKINAKKEGKDIMVDMHIHTTFSDGSDDVVKISEYAKEYDLFSITDHNNIMSSKSVQADNFIPGVELSVNGSEFDLSPEKEIHFVAYNYNPNDKTLNQLIDEFNYYNNIVYARILMNIAVKYKLKIDFDILKDLIYQNVSLNKVYLTKILMQCGIGDELYSTFDKYVKSSLSTEYYYLKYKEIFDAIKKSNGYILLAHPYQYGLHNQFDDLITKVYKLGIDGIEMTTGHYDQTMEYVKKYHFVYSAGSDYHGKDYHTCNSIGIDDTLYNKDDEYLKNILLQKLR